MGVLSVVPWLFKHPPERRGVWVGWHVFETIIPPKEWVLVGVLCVVLWLFKHPLERRGVWAGRHDF